MKRVGSPAPQRLLEVVSTRQAIAYLLVVALIIFWLGRWSEIDLWLADAAYDIHAATFPWRNAWLTDTFNHTILKRLLLLAALGFVGYAIADAIRPSARLSALSRMRLRVVASSAVLVPLVTSSLKRLSTSHCPWDLARYGGDQPYVRIFDDLPIGALPGQCLPAGHASSALWLVALAVYWLPGRPRMAWLAACAGVIFGAIVGFLQQLRGAHFLTHTLWSIWIACAIVLGAILLIQSRAFRPRPRHLPNGLNSRAERGRTPINETSDAP